MWRYRELLPIDGEPTGSGRRSDSPRSCAPTGSPNAFRLAETLHQEQYGQLPHPVLQGPRRLRRAQPRAELGSRPSPALPPATWPILWPGQRGLRRMKSYVLIPADLEESGKVLGSFVYGTNVMAFEGAYDQVNRLCSEIAGK